MRRPLSWRPLAIVAVCVIGFLSLVPNFVSRATLDALPGWLPKSQIILGLDLQGGSYLLLEVELGPVYKERLETMVSDMRGALRTARVNYRGLGVQGDTVTVTLTDPAQLDQARAEIEKLNPFTVGAGGRVRDFDVAADPGGRIVLRLTDAKRTQLAQSAVSQSLEVVRRRIDELGTREASIQRQGADRILVQVPGERNPENIKRLLGRTARLTFHMVDLGASIEDALQGRVPPGSMLVEAADNERGGPGHYVVKRQVDISGESLVDAQPTFQDNQPVVSFRFDNAGARKFGRITQENVGKPFAIVLDDKVISAPRINEPILGGSGIISGSFTVESANELAVLLRAGALPAPLKVIEERSVGAELGADSIRAGAIACVVASVLVVGLMLIYYGVFGVIADIALVLNVVLILGIMTLLGATLTLPGIAGIVLTIGQAVDSNVLIYERIREEMKGGRTPLAAINAGFGEAMRTIIDANLTALIAALALFQFGSGPVKGFAVTLGLGVITNMFTAVYFSRFLVAIWYDRTRPAALPL
jgi:protein-export membrane protein SecD